jgi:hypothetical protein
MVKTRSMTQSLPDIGQAHKLETIDVYLKLFVVLTFLSFGLAFLFNVCDITNYLLNNVDYFAKHYAYLYYDYCFLSEIT